MAKTSKTKKEVSMEEALWKSADKLRGSVETSEYKHVVLSLFFLKFASDRFTSQRELITKKYGDKFIDNKAFITGANEHHARSIGRLSAASTNAIWNSISILMQYSVGLFLYSSLSSFLEYSLRISAIEA